jgi:predicted regulator of Ras-like GTPase activity (Roadblock/LC7/MglB family)
MEHILGELNKTSDVVGSFVVAEDGIIVASDLESEIDAEMIGALVSSVIRASKQAVDKMEYGDTKNFMLEADKNKLFFSKCRFGFLVVVTGPEANLGLIRVEVRNAVKKLEAMTL